MRIASVVIMVTLVSIGGCGSRSNVATVTGRVTYGGRPVQGLEVTFSPQGQGRNSVGYSNAEGIYELQYTLNERGAQIGQHSVSVDDVTGKTKIPPEFHRLSFEVKPGSNQFDIDIPTN